MANARDVFDSPIVDSVGRNLETAMAPTSGPLTSPDGAGPSPHQSIDVTHVILVCVSLFVFFGTILALAITKSEKRLPGQRQKYTDKIKRTSLVRKIRQTETLGKEHEFEKLDDDEGSDIEDKEEEEKPRSKSFFNGWWSLDHGFGSAKPPSLNYSSKWASDDDTLYSSDRSSLDEMKGSNKVPGSRKKTMDEDEDDVDAVERYLLGGGITPGKDGLLHSSAHSPPQTPRLSTSRTIHPSMSTIRLLTGDSPVRASPQRGNLEDSTANESDLESTPRATARSGLRAAYGTDLDAHSEGATLERGPTTSSTRSFFDRVANAFGGGSGGRRTSTSIFSFETVSSERYTMPASPSRRPRARQAKIAVRAGGVSGRTAHAKGTSPTSSSMAQQEAGSRRFANGAQGQRANEDVNGEVSSGGGPVVEARRALPSFSAALGSPSADSTPSRYSLSYDLSDPASLDESSEESSADVPIRFRRVDGKPARRISGGRTEPVGAARSRTQSQSRPPGGQTPRRMGGLLGGAFSPGPSVDDTPSRYSLRYDDLAPALTPSTSGPASSRHTLVRVERSTAPSPSSPSRHRRGASSLSSDSASSTLVSDADAEPLEEEDVALVANRTTPDGARSLLGWGGRPFGVKRRTPSSRVEEGLGFRSASSSSSRSASDHRGSRGSRVQDGDGEDDEGADGDGEGEHTGLTGGKVDPEEEDLEPGTPSKRKPRRGGQAAAGRSWGVAAGLDGVRRQLFGPGKG